MDKSTLRMYYRRIPQPHNFLWVDFMLERLVQRFLYYPTVLRAGEPLPSFAKDAQEVWIDSADGNRIHGLYWQAYKNRPTILFFHGNAQSVFEWSLIRQDLESLDCGLLMIDYPGYGKSSGSPSEKGLYSAGEAALQWLLDMGIPERKIIVHGKSLGGGVAAHIAQNRELLGVIFESTFRSIPDVFLHFFSFLPEKARLKSEKYEVMTMLERIQSPMLFIHGTKDEVIPVDETHKLFEKASAPKDLYIVPGAGHNDVALVANSEYGNKLRNWLDRLG